MSGCGERLDCLREAGPGCPSDLALDRLVAAELPSTEARSLEAHAQACATCADRIARRELRFAAWPEVDARRIFAAVRARLTSGSER